MIANTTAGLILLLCSLFGYPCSCTYLIIRKIKMPFNLFVANIYTLGRLHTNRPILDNKKKIGFIIFFFLAIIAVSAGLSISIYEFVHYLSNNKDQDPNKTTSGNVTSIFE